jgi:hypothetical protein
MNYTIHIQATDETGFEDTQSWDLDKPHELYKLLLGLGNGCFVEMRVEASHQEGIDRFIEILHAGGYKEAPPLASGIRCFPHTKPFIFINPIKNI